MEQLYLIFTQNTTFMLLFARVGGLFLFFPFFSHTNVSVIFKTALALVFSFFLLDRASVEFLPYGVGIGIFFEILFGMCAGIFLQLCFSILHLGGHFISQSMGFTMANTLDPTIGAQVPIVSNIIYLIALLSFLEYDGHHLIILFINNSIDHIQLGGFLMQEQILQAILKSLKDLYLIAFCMAFPVMGICFLGDFIFGMLMKTMPQFNLLTIGYPVKIAIAFSVLIALLNGLMFFFKGLILELFGNLNSLFF